MKKVLSIGNALIAIIAGVLVLLGYLLPTLLGGLRQYLIQLAVILTAFAVLLGIFNLASVHWKRATEPKAGANNALQRGITALAGAHHPAGQYRRTDGLLVDLAGQYLPDSGRDQLCWRSWQSCFSLQLPACSAAACIGHRCSSSAPRCWYL